MSNPETHTCKYPRMAAGVAMLNLTAALALGLAGSYWLALINVLVALTFLHDLFRDPRYATRWWPWG